MGAFILRRLVQAVFTLLGVMLLTFVLFRLVAGDVSAQFVNPKLGKEARIAWLRKNKLDVPLLVNLQRRLVFTDRTEGEKPLEVRDLPGSKAVGAMVLENPKDDATPDVVVSIPLQLLSRATPVAELTDGDPWTQPPKAKPPARAPPAGATQPTMASAPAASQPAAATAPAATPPCPGVVFALADGSELEVDLSGLSQRRKDGALGAADGATCGELIDLINNDPDNRRRLAAGISEVDLGGVFESQFFRHLIDSVTFQSRSYKTNEKLLDIIVLRARYSLAITVPAMVLGWFTALVVSALVAYYRARLIDKLGVFICVLGMCVPYLVYMIAGQALIFEIAPTAAWGLHNRANIYVPVFIAVVAGVGGSVRFYRTIILDEVSRDYVRTARAKGVPLPGILFKHVLKNCMLPILTSLVISIPFLVMGSLLLENFFGVPGLGSLMVNSVSDRDVPIISGLTFLTAAIYIVGLLITDVLYAVFDPRVRLR